MAISAEADGRIAVPADQAVGVDGAPGMIPVSPREWEAPAGDESSSDSEARGRRWLLKPSQRPLWWDGAGLAAGASLAGLLFGAPFASLAAFSALLLVGLTLRGHYRGHAGTSVLDDLPSLLATCGVAALTVAVIRYGFGSVPATADLVDGVLLVIAGVITSRVLLSALRRHLLVRGLGARRTMICGSSRLAHQLRDRLDKQPALGLRPVALSDPESIEGNEAEPTILLPPSRTSAQDWLVAHRIEHLIVAMAPDLAERYAPLVEACHILEIPVSYVARGLEQRVTGRELPATAGVPLLHIGTQRSRTALALKHGADRTVAGLSLLLLTPLFIGVAVAIRVTMGSPVYFRQDRIGVGGQPFQMLKFRTMLESLDGAADKDDGASWRPGTGLGPGGVEGRDRRTRLGRLLRRTSLDELPQLVNVLRGEMSLVGPRPERPEYVAQFLSEVHKYSERHRVRVGITGLAQVQGLRGQTSLAERIEMDNYYIDNWSLWLDAQILLRTVRAVVADQPD